MNTKSLLLAIAIVCSLTAAVAVNAQKLVVKGGESCEDYLLKKIARDKAKGSRMFKLKAKERTPTRAGRSAVNTPIVKLKVFETDNKTLSENLENWLEDRDIEYLVALQLGHKEKKALILGSRNIGATGIASNLQNWYIRLDSHSIEFLSLSKDPRLIFWGRNGLLNYYAINYGSRFLEKRDWDNVTLDLLRYSVSHDGESQLVREERNVRCK